MNRAFSKILISAILIVLVGGGIFAWQYFGVPKEEAKGPGGTPEGITKDETADWQTYRNEEYGFEIKYPREFTFSSSGPNDEQQRLDKGETISGTVQPSYDTVIFSRNNKEQFKIEMFHSYKKAISPENYEDGYFYLYGNCDLRWGFEPTVIQIVKNSSIEILEVKGKFLGPGIKTPTFRGCYYFKNYSNNLIVFSTADLENQLDFKQVDSTVGNILLTLNLFSQKSGVPDTAPSITVISPNGGEKWEVGKTYDIKWKSQGFSEVVILVVHSSGGVVDVGRFVSSAIAGEKSYSWTIPQNFFSVYIGWKPGDKFKIFIDEIQTDGTFISANDYSDNYFTIN